MPTGVSDPRGPSDLAGRRVLVTGAGSGIGAALARGFAAAGAAVALHHHRSGPAAEALAEGIRAAGGAAIVLGADLTCRAEAARVVDAAVAGLGGLDVLVNNAGGPCLLRPVAELDDAEFDRIFALNAASVFATCRAAIPALRARADRPGGAAIVNVTSQSARSGSAPGAAVYGASKAFVTAFTKTLARELAADGIRVNAMSPGFVETPLHHGFTPPDLARDWVRQIPFGRAGTPEDCVGPALFLASPALSGFLTGQVIEVNGGQSMPG